MNTKRQTVCLCMIVKNEHHILRRCLDSVRGLIDTWLIVDTGSTDGTQQLATEYFHDLPGELVERPWRNFGHNRTESLQLASPKADYLLIMDADEYLEPAANFAWPEFTADAYDFQMLSGGLNYYKIQLIRSALPWRFEGVLHEYVTCDRTHTQEHMPHMQTIRKQEGARSRDPLTYQRDALLLEEALLTDPANARHMFYLAQSYRDARMPDAAIDRYRRRIAMGGWGEEVWYSLYEIANLLQAKGAPWSEVLDAYLATYAYRPGRAEPLYNIGKQYQAANNHAAALIFFTYALAIPYPKDDILFVNTEVYNSLLSLEYAVSCYWVGRHHEAIAVIDRLLLDASQPAERRELLQRNRQFSMDALRAASTT